MRFALVLVVAVLAAAPAAAQQYPYPYAPVPTPGNFLPNYYNRTSQPLSPYLNLLRGGNAGVNYFYGVRPGTPAGGMTPRGTPATPLQFGPTTQFLPQAAVVVDPAADPIEPGARETTLRPAGHPVLYGNTFNGHGSALSQTPGMARGVGGPASAGGPRPGASGLGLSPRPSPRR